MGTGINLPSTPLKATQSPEISGQLQSHNSGPRLKVSGIIVGKVARAFAALVPLRAFLPPPCEDGWVGVGVGGQM